MHGIACYTLRLHDALYICFFMDCSISLQIMIDFLKLFIWEAEKEHKLPSSGSLCKCPQCLGLRQAEARTSEPKSIQVSHIVAEIQLPEPSPAVSQSLY